MAEKEVNMFLIPEIITIAIVSVIVFLIGLAVGYFAL